ncbi:hypothetical protein ACQP2T_31215 [Nonomuraea sp. CA-143628]|uniref:hypothetical protein n=1 Tax=Nonomuraea sp. CA-143628 TaxID=3239997 RepID=UPI003D9273C9
MINDRNLPASVQVRQIRWKFPRDYSEAVLADAEAHRALERRDVHRKIVLTTF